MTLLRLGLILCLTAPSAGVAADAQQPDANEGQTAQTAQPSFPAGSIGVPMTPFRIPANRQAGDAPPVTEEHLRAQLAGNTFYIRGGYLDNSLHFNAKGALDGNSPRASHTLSLVEIDRVRLEKHSLQLEGVRYGLHFLGALATEDQTQALDKVRLTTKKKPLRITIDREQVIKPKKQKESKSRQIASTTDESAPTSKPSAGGRSTVPQNAPEAGADNVTTSQAHANGALIEALDHVFAAGVDDRLLATLPDYWRLFYQSIAERHDYRPADSGVLFSSQVDQKAKLLSAFEPPSNEYAQNNGVAGMALYHVIVGADGKPQQIAVGRPIGFGLDENAVDSIRKATFQAGMKDGKPVPVMLDLVVQFRIFSKRTAAATTNQATAPVAPVLPGPYSVNQAASQQQSAAQSQ